MPITVHCPNPKCRKRITFLNDSAGESVSCPMACGSRIRVPSLASPCVPRPSPVSPPLRFVQQPVATPAPLPTPSKFALRPLLQVASIGVELLKKCGAFG
jgi:hypothetical protein